MRTIKLISLELNKFKNHDHLKIDFGGANAAIYGDNATGKTSVYDALTWLLFGKNSRGDGDKNFEVKPLGADGEVKDHDAITSVEAVLSVDGAEIALKRTLREIWATKRGSSVPVFDGNTSEYFIDGVPVKKYAFADKVSEIVGEDVFKLLTSVSHFAEGISWQDRRAVLFKAAGIASDHEIMARDERFLPLIEAMGRLELEDYKKKLIAEKRGHVGTRDEIPARISECEKTIEDVEALDFAKAKAEVEILTAQCESLEAQRLSIEHNSAADNKRIEIREAQLELSAIENENKAFRASQLANAPDIASTRTNLTRLQMQHSAKIKSKEHENAYIVSLDGEIAASRERWIATNSETFTGGSCPTCGQALPSAQLKAATDAFEAQKAKRLREIEQTANASKAARAAAIDRLGAISDEIAALESEITKTSGIITAAEATVIEPVDMADYQAKKAAVAEKINALSGELADMMADSTAARNDLQRQIAEVKAQISAQRDIISKESLLEYSRKRVEELREDARNAAQCLEAIEGMLFLIDEYSRYKTQFVEDSVNGLFRIARFRLFREQANGGVEERCDVVLDGVPYANLNSGARINVGVDIINTLSVIYGVRVPLFVDNAESVTALEPCASQTIRLIVSENDRKLRIEI